MTDATAGKVRCENDLLARGFVQVPVLVLQDHDLSAGAKLTYGALLWYLWRGGDYPGQVAMSEEFGMGERSVRRYLAELEDRGYLRHERPGLGQVNTYQILTPWAESPDRPNWPVRPAKSAGQDGQPGRSQERQDSKAHTSQQQGRAKPGGDRGLPAARRTAVVVASSTEEEADGLTERLAALGVAKSTGQALLKQYGPELVGRWLAYTEHRLREGWLPRETPAAWLVSAIRSGDWILPEWFKTPAEEAAAAAADREAATERTRQQAEAQERDREEAAAQRRELEERLGVDDATRELWRQTLELLEERGEGSISLASAYLLPLAGEVATLATPVAFFCKMIPRHEAAIRAALEELTGRPVRAVEVRGC